MSLKNLALLTGGAGSYNKCKSEKISKVMKEYEKGKLENRSSEPITNQKQAIAIALSQAQSTCKYNKSDVKNLIDKVNEDLNDIAKKINLSNLIETKDAIEKLYKMKKNKRVYIFKKLLWDKIILAHRNGETLNKNMWDEIYKIHQL
jgi:L-lactate utilization protein LutC